MSEDEINSLIRVTISLAIAAACLVFYMRRPARGIDYVQETVSCDKQDKPVGVPAPKNELDLLNTLVELERELGPWHLETLACLDDLLWHYREVGNRGEAWAIYWRQMKAFGHILGIPYTDEREVLSRMSSVYAQAGNPEMAERLYERGAGRLPVV
ncbi:MAG: hypothetical protein PHI11_10490 [Gallionella sp.]|nr:hypothetical protein [Gallionella sp.]